MSFLIMLLIGQMVAMVCVMAALKIALDRMLVDLAARYLDACHPSEAAHPNRIQVVSFAPLKKNMMERMQRAAARYGLLGQGAIDFQVNRTLWGGAVIYLGDQTADFSLRDRMRKAVQLG